MVAASTWHDVIHAMAEKYSGRQRDCLCKSSPICRDLPVDFDRRLAQVVNTLPIMVWGSACKPPCDCSRISKLGRAILATPQARVFTRSCARRTNPNDGDQQTNPCNACYAVPHQPCSRYSRPESKMAHQDLRHAFRRNLSLSSQGKSCLRRTQSAVHRWHSDGEHNRPTMRR